MKHKTNQYVTIGFWAALVLFALLVITQTTLAQSLDLPTDEPPASEVTPESVAEVTAVAPVPDVVVNVNPTPAPTSDNNDAQTLVTLVALIAGAIFGGGSALVISSRAREKLESDPVTMDALERKYHQGNAMTRAFLDKAAREARGWLDFQSKISDGVLSDGTKLE